MMFGSLRLHLVKALVLQHKCKFCCVVVLAALFLLVTIFVVPMRNVIFRPYIHEAWRDVHTHDIIRMRYLHKSEPEDYKVSVACDVIVGMTDVSPTTGKNRLDPRAILTHNNVTDDQRHAMLSQGLGRYIPSLSISQKMEALRLYLALADALQRHNITFFFTAGSILGVVRHGGFVPWDDDLDVGVDVETMSETRRALSCIRGTEVNRFGTFHWKFRYQGQVFPFIDVFMYAKDDQYLWALTSYITNTFVYLRENVFPLTWARYEGNISVPVPGKPLEVLKRIYRFSQCKAYKPHNGLETSWKVQYPKGYSKADIPCRTLAPYYRMFHLD